MKLLIDAGNSRIKWALVNQQDWLRSGVLPVEQADKFAQQFAELRDLRHSDIQQIWVSNVAGEKIARHLADMAVGLHVLPHYIVARQAQGGVRNGYANPAQLGSDRWAALIAAWHQVRGACLVVNCGTATTIDTLSDQGEFLGGLILPGVELMQRSLIAATDQLRPSVGKVGEGKTGEDEISWGEYVSQPKNTADALYSGAIRASCGAIQSQYALLGDARAPVVLGGGAAGLLQAQLGMPLRVVDNLVLQGLLIIAREAEGR